MRSRGDERSVDANLTREAAYAHASTPGRGGVLLGRGAFAWGHDLPGLLWLVALAIAAAYVVVFVVQLPRDVTELAWDSDYASGFTIPETLVHSGTGANTVLASAGQWVPLWFGLLTAGLPLHRELWGIAPTLLFVATALTVGWSVARLANRRAGALAVLIAVIASPLALVFLMAPEAHNTVYPCTALLGAYLIWLARGDGRRRLATLGVPPLLGVVIGTCVASDLLVAATALIPLAVTAILAGVRRERRCRCVSLSALTTVAVAIPVAKLTSAIMHSLGFVTIETPARAAPLSELATRAQLLFRGLKALFNGYLASGRPGTLHAPLGIASEVVMSAALLTLIVVGARGALGLLRGDVRGGVRGEGAQAPAQLSRSLHVVYWVSSAGAACGVFWLAAETGGATNLHESYYGTVIFSVAAVLPLSLGAVSPARWPLRWLAPAGAVVFFAASLAGLTSNYMNGSARIAGEAGRVVKIARANHVTFGYGGYWAASSLTWNTHGRVTVRPLMECSNPEGAGICPFYEARVPAWYVPAQRHTFLLIDSEEAWVRALPPGLGRPLASYSFGTMQMLVYPYDIASRLGPALN